MKNILVPIDFSNASRNAANYAASLAQAFDARVTLINAIERPTLVDDSVLAPVMVTQAEIVQENSNLINQEMESLLKIYPVRMDAFVREGFITETIGNLATEIAADLIVVGMKGKGESRAFLGSTVTKITRRLSHPVLVVPAKASFQLPATIAVASDFDPDFENQQYHLLIELAQKFDSMFKIVNVAVKGRQMKPSQAIGKMKISRALAQYATEFHTIREDKVDEGLENFLEEQDPDLLVMIAREHSFIDRLFGKVHTKEMSYKTRKPLLILPGK
jgi:nucleotide-binding universal stress UspA family protein